MKRSSLLFLPGRFWGPGKVFILRYFLTVFLSKPVCLEISLMLKFCELRNDETIISSISVTDIFFDVYWGNGIIEPLPK